MTGSFEKLEIDTQRLQTDIEELRSELEKLCSTGRGMMDGIEGLSSMWEGEAKNAFTEQFREDYGTLEEMEETIEKLIERLEEARDEYVTCESEVGSRIDSIRI